MADGIRSKVVTAVLRGVGGGRVCLRAALVDIKFMKRLALP